MTTSAELQKLLTSGEAGLRPELLQALPEPWRFTNPEDYHYDLDDEALQTAVKAALLLGQPLIVAGEPGVGKTSLADALAQRLKLHFHQPIQVKSATSGLDLFYHFDEVARFRDASAGGAADGGRRLRDYVRFTSLGRAILWSAGPDAVVAAGTVPLSEIAPDDRDRREITLGELFPHEFEVRAKQPGAPWTRVDKSGRSLVLIDELDKAPRDAPNDVLGELERLTFRIGELDLEIAANKRQWPVVLITSNSERSFPDAFLRRCVFHWIDYPAPERLQRIAAARCSDLGLRSDDRLVSSAVTLFEKVRGGVQNKKPSTAELISLLRTLRAFGARRDEEIASTDLRVVQALGVLVKTRVDSQLVAPAPDKRGT